MSAILLQNPFASLPQLPSIGASDQVGTHAIAPPSGASSGAGSGDSTSFGKSGNGHGGSAQSALAFLAKSRTPPRPANATPASIVGAQVSDGAQQRKIPEKIGPDLPEVEMPDPLPTSPFLLMMAKNTGSAKPMDAP